eukprot:scaffold1368_cov333-Pavlova_lutheri.AAC.20
MRRDSLCPPTPAARTANPLCQYTTQRFGPRHSTQTENVGPDRATNGTMPTWQSTVFPPSREASQHNQVVVQGARWRLARSSCWRAALAENNKTVRKACSGISHGGRSP